MQTAFIVIGLIIAVLFLLLIALFCFPITLRLKMQNSTVSFRMSFFGIPVYRYPKKKRLLTHAPKEKNKAKTESTPLAPLPPSTDPEALLSYAKTLFGELTRFSKHTKTKLYRLSLTPPAMDAAEAALVHTALSGGVAAILDLLDKNTDLTITSRNSVYICPNFTEEKAAFCLDISLSFAPHHALRTLGNLSQRLTQIQS